MIHALPLIWCVSPDTRAKLLGMVSVLSCVPADAMVEWKPVKRKVKYGNLYLPTFDYDKFMRQAPYPGRPKP